MTGITCRRLMQYFSYIVQNCCQELGKSILEARTHHTNIDLEFDQGIIAVR